MVNLNIPSISIPKLQALLDLLQLQKLIYSIFENSFPHHKQSAMKDSCK